MSSISAWLNGAPRCGQVSSIQYSSGALHDEGPVKTCPIADPLLPPNEASGLLILKSNRRWYTTGWSTVRRARWKRVWVKVALRGAILVIRQAVRTIWMYIPDELLWNGHLCCSVICCCFWGETNEIWMVIYLLSAIQARSAEIMTSFYYNMGQTGVDFDPSCLVLFFLFSCIDIYS